MRRTQQWSESCRQRRPVALRQGQQVRVPPHGGSLLRDSLACKSPARSVVVIGNFKGRKTVVADRAGLIAPTLLALTAAQLVWCTHQPLFRVAGDEPGKESLKTETSFPDRRKRGYEVLK